MCARCNFRGLKCHRGQIWWKKCEKRIKRWLERRNCLIVLRKWAGCRAVNVTWARLLKNNTAFPFYHITTHRYRIRISALPISKTWQVETCGASIQNKKQIRALVRPHTHVRTNVGWLMTLKLHKRRWVTSMNAGSKLSGRRKST